MTGTIQTIRMQITRMKDGRTHLAHKAEHAVDLDSGAVLAVTVQAATAGDTRSFYDTLGTCHAQLMEVYGVSDPEACGALPAEVVFDKGYHSNDVLMALQQVRIRSYCSEPDPGRRNWANRAEEKVAVYANRRRIRGERGRRLLRRRGEYVERSFAHLYETGRMRRTYLRRHGNILKRLLIHASAFNLGLLMRKLCGSGTPRQLRANRKAALWALNGFVVAIMYVLTLMINWPAVSLRKSCCKISATSMLMA